MGRKKKVHTYNEHVTSGLVIRENTEYIHILNRDDVIKESYKYLTNPEKLYNRDQLAALTELGKDNTKKVHLMMGVMMLDKLKSISKTDTVMTALLEKLASQITDMKPGEVLAAIQIMSQSASEQTKALLSFFGDPDSKEPSVLVQILNNNLTHNTQTVNNVDNSQSNDNYLITTHKPNHLADKLSKVDPSRLDMILRLAQTINEKAQMRTINGPKVTDGSTSDNGSE